MLPPLLATVLAHSFTRSMTTPATSATAPTEQLARPIGQSTPSSWLSAIVNHTRHAMSLTIRSLSTALGARTIGQVPTPARAKQASAAGVASPQAQAFFADGLMKDTQVTTQTAKGKFIAKQERSLASEVQDSEFQEKVAGLTIHNNVMKDITRTMQVVIDGEPVGDSAKMSKEELGKSYTQKLKKMVGGDEELALWVSATTQQGVLTRCAQFLLKEKTPFVLTNPVDGRPTRICPGPSKLNTFNVSKNDDGSVLVQAEWRVQAKAVISDDEMAQGKMGAMTSVGEGDDGGTRLSDDSEVRMKFGILVKPKSAENPKPSYTLSPSHPLVVEQHLIPHPEQPARD